MNNVRHLHDMAGIKTMISSSCYERDFHIDIVFNRKSETQISLCTRSPTLS